MTDYERLTAVIAENNALRKNTEKLTSQLREAREALARAHETASKANGRAESFASALRRQRADRTLELEAEWNAAIEAAEAVAVTPDASGRGTNDYIARRIRALKREVKP